MSKKICKFSGALMLVIASAFIAYALNHPEASFNINITVLYIIYGIYAVIMVGLLVFGFKKEKKQGQ